MTSVESTTDMRAKILAAAIDVLRTKGVPAFTVRSVAEAAGCSTTGVYTWFGGKNGLLDAIFVAGFDSFDHALASAPSFRDTGVAYRNWALENPTLYLVIFGRAVAGYKPSDATQARALESFDRLVDLVGDETTAYHTWATVHGYVMIELAGIAASAERFHPEQSYNAGLDRLLLTDPTSAPD